MLDKKIGIIGCGNMGEALINGIISSGLVDKRNLMASDPLEERRRLIKTRFGVETAESNQELVKFADCLIIAVKPQSLDVLLAEIGGILEPTRLVISIAAGVTTKKLEGSFKNRVSVIRVMPNTPALVSKGISAVCPGRYASPEDKDLALKIFTAVGEVVEVEEPLMDIVTAISGSGPAYFFFLIESLIETGKKEGLSEKVAKKLAIQTALGAGHLVLQAKKDPGVLRQMVTSKGGTTEAAFRVFEAAGLGKIFEDGIKAAANRSKELSGG